VTGFASSKLGKLVAWDADTVFATRLVDATLGEEDD
jgi:hypothetical protein